MAKNPYNWGYRQAAKDSADMGFATGGKVGCATGGAVQKYAKGGAVKHSDVKQDRALMERHNRLMHPGQKSKLASGGPAKKNWIAAATKNKGGLHKSLGIAQGKKIPAKTLAKAATKGGKVGKQAKLAQTLKSFKK